MSSSPVDVSKAKQCRLCRQHSIAINYLDHKVCPFQDCKCQRCNLIRLQRCIMAEQIKLRRKKETRSVKSTPYSNYNCQRCKNHGVETSKKNHNDCPYTNCACELCVLAKARSYVELEIKQSCKLVKESRKMKGKTEMDNEMVELMFNIFAKNTPIESKETPTTPPSSLKEEPLFNGSNVLSSQNFSPSPLKEEPLFNGASVLSPQNFAPSPTFTLIPSTPNFTPAVSPLNLLFPTFDINCLSQPKIGQRFTLVPCNFNNDQYLNSLNLP